MASPKLQGTDRSRITGAGRPRAKASAASEGKGGLLLLPLPLLPRENQAPRGCNVACAGPACVPSLLLAGQCLNNEGKGSTMPSSWSVNGPFGRITGPLCSYCSKTETSLATDYQKNWARKLRPVGASSKYLGLPACLQTEFEWMECFHSGGAEDKSRRKKSEHEKRGDDGVGGTAGCAGDLSLTRILFPLPPLLLLLCCRLQPRKLVLSDLVVCSANRLTRKIRVG